MFNYNDTVKFTDVYGQLRSGTIVEVSSDMDSYEDMQLKDGVAMYWSKKTKKYVPVKPKNEDTVYLTVKGVKGKYDYIFLNEIVEVELKTVGSNCEGDVSVNR